MTADDVQAQVRAAIQQVRTSTPRECDEWSATIAEDGTDAATHSDACWLRWAERVDARLAVCVEALYMAAYPELADVEDALAAFLAAAAQKETP